MKSSEILEKINSGKMSSAKIMYYMDKVKVKTLGEFFFALTVN